MRSLFAIAAVGALIATGTSFHSPKNAPLQELIVDARVASKNDDSGFVRGATPSASTGSRIKEAVASLDVITRIDERPYKAHGVYLNVQSGGDHAFVENIIQELKSASGNAIVFDVKGSRVYFDSASQYAHNLDLVVPIVDLPWIVSTLRENGIYSIARYVALKDEGFSTNEPRAQIRHPETGESVGSLWVDPGTDEAIEYNRQILDEVAASGVDEINIDYIRYPTEYGSWQIDRTGEEKAERLIKFLKMARETIDSHHMGTKLGVSTFAILGWNFPVNFEPLGQDIPAFADIVDVVSPMAYPSTFSVGPYYNADRDPGSRDYYLVYRTLEGYEELMGEKNAHKLRPWIQGYYMDQKGIQDQIQAIYDSGHCGFSVWSAGNHYEIFLSALKNMQRPERCLANQG